MRVFVTGATGFIGSALIPELVNAGHQVLGLTRSDEGAQLLAAAGAQVHRGDLEDLESLRSGAAACDAVIHTAFRHDWSRFAESCELDKHASRNVSSGERGSAFRGSAVPSSSAVRFGPRRASGATPQRRRGVRLRRRWTMEPIQLSLVALHLESRSRPTRQGLGCRWPIHR